MRTVFDQIIAALGRAGRIALICHVSPDGDTLGAALALARVLRAESRDVTVVCDGTAPDNCALIPGIETLKTPAEAGKTAFDLAVAVDVAEPERMGAARGLFDAAPVTVNIDHHISNTRFAQINCVSQRGATAEIVFDLLRARGTALDKETAEALYIAVSTDTGGFTYANADGDTYRVAAALVDTGLDVAGINDFVFKRRSLTRTRLIALAIENLTVEDSLAVISLPYAALAALGAQEGDTDGLVNYAREVEGVRTAVLARETETGQIRVSLRSDGAVDVCRVAAQFGGGGHRQAAGCTLEMPLEAAVKALRDAVRQNG